MNEGATVMSSPFDKNSPLSATAVEKIVPRAEFRVFGQGVIDIVQKKMWDAGATLQKARQMPAEVYFLSRHTDEANVKVRDALLDIKVKVGDTAEGYEIFRPSGKFQFPMRQADLALILKHLQVVLKLDQDAYACNEFVTLARTHPDIVPVGIEKMRYGFTVNEVICEYARVWVNGALIETACCESENYAALQKVIEMLGIAAMPNTSYLKAAKRIIGMI
jgi:hypothetical protein